MSIQTTTVGGIRTRYWRSGVGDPLLVLHGWGSRIENWQAATASLEKAGFEIILPDLPGFGESAEPPADWSVGDYVGWVKAFTKEAGLTRYHLLGHSFGGRIGIKLAAEVDTPVGHLILCAAAGVSRPGMIQRFKVQVFRLLSRVGKGISSVGWVRRLWYSLARERDYEAASPRMKKVMQQVIAEDLSSFLSQIKRPALVVWGEKDRATPLADGQRIAAGISGARLEVLPGVRHGVHRQAPEELVGLVRMFLTQ